MERALTLGEQRVRMDFNPAGNPDVKTIKEAVASMIDFIEAHKIVDPRLGSLAQTAFEEGAMWAVKLVTTPPTSN